MNILPTGSLPSIDLPDVANVTSDGNRTGANDFLEKFRALSEQGSDKPLQAVTDGQTADPPEKDELRDAFRKFVGTTLYGQMLKSMRSTVGKPAYMHGGQTEEIFQQQMDQIMVDDLTEKSASTIADPMYDLFNLRRGG